MTLDKTSLSIILSQKTVWRKKIIQMNLRTLEKSTVTGTKPCTQNKFIFPRSKGQGMGRGWTEGEVGISSVVSGKIRTVARPRRGGFTRQWHNGCSTNLIGLLRHTCCLARVCYRRTLIGGGERRKKKTSVGRKLAIILRSAGEVIPTNIDRYSYLFFN